MNVSTMPAGLRWATMLCAVLLLPGCATFSSDGGFDAVARTARERLDKDVRWMRTSEERAKTDRQTEQLLDRPMSVNDAVQVALLNNRSLQASFEELGISEADLVESGRLPNPRFVVRHSSAGGLYDIEETVSVNVLSLLTLPYRHAIQKRRFEAVRSAIAVEIVQLAARTREAYFTALAARDTVRYLVEVRDAAQTGAKLASKMREAGNWTRLDEAREQGFYSEAEVGMERARSAEAVARENLAQLLGIDAAFELAERLPELPQSVDAPPAIGSTAPSSGALGSGAPGSGAPGSAALDQHLLDNRIDLQMMRARIDALARELKLTKSTRFVNVLDAGPTRVREGSSSQPFETGYEVMLEVPIFDTGAPRVRRAEAIYAQAVDRYGQAVLEARSQVRKAYAQYRAAHAIAARERDELLPLRKSISAEDVLRYDAAQISVFDLLADARAEIGGQIDYIQSLRDFWIARSALDSALLGSPAQT